MTTKTDAVDVVNELRKFQRTYMTAGLHEEADAMAGIFAVVSELIEAAVSVIEADDTLDGVKLEHSDRLRAALARATNGAQT